MHQMFSSISYKVDPVVEFAAVSPLAATDRLVPRDFINEPILVLANLLNSWKRHFDEFPFDVAYEFVIAIGRRDSTSVHAGAWIIPAAAPETFNESNDRRLFAGILLKDHALPYIERHGLAPIEFDHLLRQLSRSHHGRWRTILLALLKA